MAPRGRIRAADIALVRERAKIDEIVGEHLQLKRAGGGSLKGLCPFHDEKSPSFQVDAYAELYHCFGCGVGGDVISFIQQIDHLSFSEAVELLAGRANVELHYEDDSGRATGARPGQRRPARPAGRGQHRRRGLLRRAARHRPRPRRPGSSSPSAASTGRSAIDFGCGFAPGGWDALTRHLRGKGFTQAELVTGGLAKESSRGTLIDRFHRRLVWPIRDITGDVIGFGARKLMDDDPGPKYLNTPETPLYKKSTVLYGIERAKRDIAKQAPGRRRRGLHRRHGVPPRRRHHRGRLLRHRVRRRAHQRAAPAADGPGRVPRRGRLHLRRRRGGPGGRDEDVRRGPALRRPDLRGGRAERPDPCELRQEHGDAAVRDLVARRTPLIEFVLKTTLAGYDLDTVEGRVAALEKTAPLLAQIKDHALRPAYARRLAGLLGLPDEAEVIERRPPADRRRRRPAAAPRPRAPAHAGRRGDRGRAGGGEGGAAGARDRRPVVRRRPARGLHRPGLRRGGRGRRRGRGGGGRDGTGPAWLDEVAAHCSRDSARAHAHRAGRRADAVGR